MPEAAPPPIDPPPVPQGDKPMGSLFDTYDPQGALGGLFAPAFIRGYAPSENAVNARYMNRPTAYDIEASRLPPEFRSTAYGQSLINPARSQGSGPYNAGGIPGRMSFGQGQIDANILRAASMGTPYDPTTRRNEIAQRLINNRDNELATEQQLITPVGQGPPGWEGSGWTDLEGLQRLRNMRHMYE